MNPDESVKYTVDVVLAGVTVGALMQWLPPIAAGLGIVWTIMRIIESAPGTARVIVETWNNWRSRHGRKPPE